MRLVFMGTPDFAVPTLTEIVAGGHDVVGVYTRAPASAGRGMTLRVSPVQRAAERLGLPVFSPSSLRDEGATAAFRSLQPAAAVVVAYGLILPQAVLDVPSLGCYNLHASLLPRWRGAAPIQRALMAGDPATGVMVMRMEAGLDTGPVAMAEQIAITPDMTAGTLHDQLASGGAALMGRALDALSRGTLRLTPQPDVGVTYAHKIEKAECRIDWHGAAPAVHDHIRGLSPFPGAFFEADFGRGRERIKVVLSRIAEGEGEPGTVLRSRSGELIVACGSGAVALVRLQRAGKPATDVADFLNGTPIAPGLRLITAGT